MEVVQLLGSQGFWQHQVLRGIGSYGSRKYSALEPTSIGQYTPVLLPGEYPLTEKPGRPQSTGSQRVEHERSDPVHIYARLFLFLFFSMWQLCPSEG